MRAGVLFTGDKGSKTRPPERNRGRRLQHDNAGNPAPEDPVLTPRKRDARLNGPELGIPRVPDCGPHGANILQAGSTCLLAGFALRIRSSGRLPILRL